MVLGVVAEGRALLITLRFGLDLDGQLAERVASPLLEDTVLELVCVRGVDPPEASLAWLVLLARNLLETLVERQVVADGILQRGK